MGFTLTVKLIKIKIPKCSRKIHVETVSEEMKESSSEEEKIGILKCSKRGRVDIMNNEVKVWTYSSKQQEAPPEITKTKEKISLEQMKRRVKIESL